MARQTKQQKIDENRINRAFNQACSGVQIPMLDIPKVFRAGQAAIDAGADDAALTEAVVAFVETIRVN